MWNLDAEGKPDPWRADSYLFGVWDLLTGKEISDVKKRQGAIRETYEEVCRFMGYYHSLAKKTERS